MRIADLFSGAGLMTLGCMEACRALGLVGRPVLASDVNAEALATYKRNLVRGDDFETIDSPIEGVIDRALGEAESASEAALRRRVGDVDIVVGGPPCQGHSDLNNHTRRFDRRNELSLRLARFAELFRPSHVIVENVRGIEHDRHGVLQRLRSALEQLGYSTDVAVVRCEDLGVPQTRRRLILAASTSSFDLSGLAQATSVPRRDFRWACGDLVRSGQGDDYDSAPTPTARNARRIDFLFDEDLYELPDDQRPACHRDHEHSYKSVYGRLHWDAPAQTITTGFRSMGQGRFVHPLKRRTITPHEAARLQFIPDFFRFGELPVGVTAGLIGNAVPPKLAYVVALELLR